MSQNYTLRRGPEIAEAERIAKVRGQKASQVIRMGLQHGLPIVDKKLETLQPAAPFAKRGMK